MLAQRNEAVRFLHQLETGRVQRYGVLRSEDTQIRDNRRLGPAGAVALRRHVEQEVQVANAAFLALYRSVGVFRHALGEVGILVGRVDADGPLLTCRYAFVTTDAAFLVDDGMTALLGFFQ